MQSIQHRTKNREISKFYEKVRSQIDELDQEQAKQLAIRDSSPNGRIYGDIHKDEFEKILNAYAEHQYSNDLKNKPVTCNSVVGRSYAKLLYSKPGFHFFGSTAVLAEDLGIQNAYRNSLLGGLVSHCPSRDEDIKGLKRRYEKMQMLDISRRACAMIDAGELKAAIAEIDRARKIDRRNPDLLVALGRYQVAINDFSKAVDYFSEALRGDPDDKPGVFKSLSDALYQGGMKMFHRSDYKNALNLFKLAVEYDGQNAGARMHYGMCQQKITDQVNLFHNRDTYRR